MEMEHQKRNLRARKPLSDCTNTIVSSQSSASNFSAAIKPRKRVVKSAVKDVVINEKKGESSSFAPASTSVNLEASNPSSDFLPTEPSSDFPPAEPNPSSDSLHTEPSSSHLPTEASTPSRRADLPSSSGTDRVSEPQSFYSRRRPTNKRKSVEIAVAPFIFSTASKIQTGGERSDRYSSPPRARTVPYKKRQRGEDGSKIELPREFVERQKAYFSEVDAFELPVEGCDGSILLDDTSSFTGEKNANPNRNSARGFDVIDNIKTAVEKACPGVVSCADILAIAARDSVVLLGGSSWNVKLGRRDARTASQSQANSDIPGPTSSLSQLTTRFGALGLSNTDLVALSGGHTIGQARCTTFRARIYSNATNIESSFARTRQGNCPSSSGSGDNNLAPLDLQTPNSFENNYFKNLLQNKGLLQSDQVLFNGGSTDSIVQNYANAPARFLSDFAAAMVRMGDISPLTGSNGEIRKNCRMVN